MNDLTRRLVETDKDCLWHPFTQMSGWLGSEPAVIDSAEGFYLFDTQGRRYIDGVSSLWCNVHGHRVREIDEAICDQLGKVAHSTLLGLGQTRSIELAERLVEIAPEGLGKVFYSDNGSTSVEIAVKMAYQYFQNIGEGGRTRFVALSNAYHGDTVGSVSVGGMKIFHGIFKDLLFKTLFVPEPHPYRFDGGAAQCAEYSLSKMRDMLDEFGGEVAAVIVEPLVQGAAGIIVHPAGFLRDVRALTREYGVLLIVDEVATGFGRTSKMFACEHEEVGPDIMCLAKGITGGYLPLAATLTTRDIFDAFLGTAAEHKTFYHGHTYTGNALGCAAAIASLRLFEENRVIESLPEKAGLIRESFGEIAGLPFVGDVRQCGMMGAIEIVMDKATKESFAYEEAVGAKLCSAMRKRGAMMRPLGDVIVVMPPVAVDTDTLRDLLKIVGDSIKEDLPKIVRSIKVQR